MWMSLCVRKNIYSEGVASLHDSSKSSLKVTVLHNGNVYPLVPVAYAVNMKETYENFKFFWELWVITIINGKYVGLESHWAFTWNATRIYQVLLFLVWVGLLGHSKSLQSEEWPLRLSLMPGGKKKLWSFIHLFSQNFITNST